MPVAAHMLLGYLVEPLKQPVEYSLYPQHNLKENIDEIQEWVMLLIDDLYLILLQNVQQFFLKMNFIDFLQCLQVDFNTIE
jgi:hypothetical protein